MGRVVLMMLVRADHEFSFTTAERYTHLNLDPWTQSLTKNHLHQMHVKFASFP